MCECSCRTSVGCHLPCTQLKYLAGDARTSYRARLTLFSQCHWRGVRLEHSEREIRAPELSQRFRAKDVAATTNRNILLLPFVLRTTCTFVLPLRDIAISFPVPFHYLMCCCDYSIARSCPGEYVIIRLEISVLRPNSCLVRWALEKLALNICISQNLDLKEDRSR